MPNHLKVLLIVLSAGFFVFYFAEKVFTPVIIRLEDFRRRQSAWVGVVLITFLSHNFWIASSLIGCLVYMLGRRDRNPAALYMTIFVAIPWHSKEVPGFGPINYFINVDYYLILNLCILLPAVIKGRSEFSASRWIIISDLSVLTYVTYVFILTAPYLSFTSYLRVAFEQFFTILLPYYAFSRIIRSGHTLREVFIAFLMGVMIIGITAPIESGKGWLIYESLYRPLDIDPPSIRTYVRRGEDGILRAIGSVGNSIVLGYVMMVGILLSWPVINRIRSAQARLFILTPLIVGLIFSLSRGPWVGVIFGLFFLMLMEKGVFKTVGLCLILLILASLLDIFFPFLSKVIDYLPFVGSVDEGSVTYRQRLLEVGLLVFSQNPIFGSLSYISNPLMEQMRQGQGIIDMVNTYLGVALAYGVIGLLLFVNPFIIAMISAFKMYLRGSSADLKITSISIFSALLSIMIAIATVSSILVVAPLYWILIGIAVSLTSKHFMADLHDKVRC